MNPIVKKHRKKLLPLMIGLASLASAESTIKQSTGGGIEEVFITVRRADENIQSVPITVAAFTPAVLKEASISTPQDLQFKTPGVFLQGSAAPQNAAYSIRGQGLSLAGTGVPGVITYFAEIPMLAYGSANPQFDMGSIQVLKGPQGTLFGRNTTGGAVLLEPAAPTYQMEGNVQGTVGNYDWREFEGMINVPIIHDKVALRIAAHSIRRDGYTKNIGVGGDFDDQHTDDFRVSLLLDPTDWLTNTTVFDRSRTDSNGAAQIFYAVTPYAAVFDPLFASFGLPGLLNGLNQNLADQKARGIRKTDSDIETVNELTVWGITNRTEVDLGSNLSLRNIFGYRSVESDSLTNLDGVGIYDNSPLFGQLLNARRILDNEQYTNELQLSGDAMDGNVEWLAGAFYFDNGPSGTNASDNTEFLTNNPAKMRFYNEKTQALYGHVAVGLDQLLDGLKLNVGYRRSWDDISVCDGNTGAQIDPPYHQDQSDCKSGNGLADASSRSKKFSGDSWTWGFDWQVSEDTFAFFTSRHGFRSGGLNSPQLAATSPLIGFQDFEPDIVTDYELGIRSDIEIGDVRARVNASVFRSYTKNKQVAIITGPFVPDGPPPFGDGNPGNDPFDNAVLVNYGEQRIDGLELSLSVKPTDWLDISIGGTFLDEETQSVKGDVAALLEGLIGAGLDIGYDPEKVPFDATPKQSYTAGIRITLPIDPAWGEVVYNVDYFRVSESDMVAIELPGYNVTNMRLDWNGIAGSAFDIGVFAKNAFDQKYVLTTADPVTISPFYSVVYGAPRLLGMQARYTF